MAEADSTLNLSAGCKSQGFSFMPLAGGALGETGKPTVVIVQRFDELTLDLAVLFDRFSPYGCLSWESVLSNYWT